MSMKVHASETSPPPTHKEDDEESLRPVTPYAFLFLSFLCVSLIYANISSFQFTITQLHDYGNGSISDFYSEWDYRFEQNTSHRVNITIQKRSYLSNPQKEFLITVVPVGTILFLIPLINIYNQFGYCRAFLLSSLLSIILSSFVPICTNVQTYAIAIMVRIIQGFSLTGFIPFMGKLCGFLNIQENPFVAWMLFSYIPAASILLFPMAGVLTDSSMGWHSVHYFYAGMLFVLILLFLTCHYSEDFKMDVMEKRWGEIMSGHSRGSSLLTLKLPYLSIYQDIQVWSIFISAFGFFSALHHCLQAGPSFFYKVLDFSLQQTGLIIGISSFLFILFGYAATVFYNRTTISETARLRIFNSIGSIVPGLFLILITFIDSYDIFVTVLYIIGTSMLGFSFAGFFRMCQKRAKQFHVFLLFHIFIVQCVSMFLTSLLNALIAQNNDYSSWRPVLIIHGCLLIVSNAIFCLFASPEPANWTKDGYEDTSIRPKRDDPLPQFPL